MYITLLVMILFVSLSYSGVVRAERDFRVPSYESRENVEDMKKIFEEKRMELKGKFELERAEFNERIQMMRGEEKKSGFFSKVFKKIFSLFKESQD